MKLVLWVLPLTALAILLLDLAAFRYIRPVMEKQLMGTMEQSVESNGELINTWLTTLMLEPETIAATPAARMINESFEDFDLMNINRFQILQDKYPEIFQDIYGSNRDGVYHTIIKEEGEIRIFAGDIANRPYFISIMNGGPTQITPPLISRTTGIPTVFVVAPIVDGKGEPAGLVGSGISLEYLQKVIGGMEREKGLFRMILSADGTVVAHTQQDTYREGLKDISAYIPGPGFRESILSGKRGRFTASYEGRDYIFFHETIGVTDWKIISAVPSGELLSPLRHLLVFLISIALAIALSQSLLVYIIMGKLIKPLREFTERTKSIALGNLEMSAVPDISNDEIGILASSFNAMIGNITDSVARLRESEKNYRSIFENSIDGIVQTNLEGTILNINPAIIKMLHFNTGEELLAFSHGQAQEFYVDSGARNRFLEELLDKDRVIQEEMRFRCSDGEIIWVSITAFLVRDDRGIPLRIESLISNISRRKEMEAESNRLQQELSQTQKLDAIGQLAGGVAHDFNNMLAVIMGYSELSLRELDRDDPSYQAFSDILDAAEHSSYLTKQLLAFARKQPVVPEVLQMNDVIDNMLTLLRRLITEDIELVFSPEEGLGKVYMDPGQIGQILTNLCVNARDSITGIGTITIKTENRRAEGGAYVLLSVKDTGSGMDEGTRSHIFEPFFTTKDPGKGTGLGLSTVYGIVKQNGGCIEVSSEPGRGTEIRIYLPPHGEVNGAAGSKSSGEALPSLPVRILLVEDDRRFLNISRILLEKLGASVIPQASPREALALVQEGLEPFDLLITDIIMPEMDGYELSRKIRESRPEAGCLFMSGYSDDIIIGKGEEPGGTYFIQKPFSLEAIAGKIREITGKH